MDTSTCKHWVPREGPFPQHPFNRNLSLWAPAIAYEACTDHTPFHLKEVTLLYNWSTGEIIDPEREQTRAQEMIPALQSLLGFDMAIAPSQPGSRRMSILLMAQVWTLDLPHNQAWLLLALCDHADDGGVAEPTIGYLAWQTSYGPRQVRRILKNLRLRGLIEWVGNHRGGRSGSGHGYGSRYRLCLARGPFKVFYEDVLSETPKQTIPATLRWAVWERDDFRCQQCGLRRDLHVDHVIARSLGGPTVLNNLQTLCQTCNIRKGSKRPPFQRRMREG